MATKTKGKKKANNTKNILLATVVIVVLVAIALVTIMFTVTPNIDNLKANLEKKDYIVLDLGDVDLLVSFFTGREIEANFTATNGDEVFTVTYFAEVSDAKEFAKENKEDAGEDSTVIRRGCAVYVGSKDSSNLFRFNAF